MTTIDLNQSFLDIFGTGEKPEHFFAPGRINLIGEHTDYNGGHVFPAAISVGTYALGRKRNDKIFRFYSLNFPDTGMVECSLRDLHYDKNHDWANYPKGMILAFKTSGYTIEQGADILFYGNIPNGAGLSSSASIEMATGVLLEDLYDIDIDRIEMVKLGQQVENNYIGVNSGIMDQFAIGMGKLSHAILLDCHTLDYEYAPLYLQDYRIIIINTNKQRTLANSKYNERRSQCELALSDLQKKLSIKSLGELTVEQFEENQMLITDETNRKRARHAVTENARTIEALTKLKQGDLIGFGKLMNLSHLSLKEDYEVTGIELDTIVKAAWSLEGVLGARMTGAGFGGCAIAIVQQDAIATFKQEVNRIYNETCGVNATFYTAMISDGAGKITKGEC